MEASLHRLHLLAWETLLMDIFHDLVISPSQFCSFHREIILLSPSVLMSKHSVCFRPPLLFPFSSRFFPLTFLYTFLFSLPTSHLYWFHFPLCLEVLHLFLWKTFLFFYVTHSNIIKMEIFFLVPFHTLEASSSSHLKSNWKACFLLFRFFCLSQVHWMAAYLRNHKHSCEKLNLLFWDFWVCR